MKPIKWYKSLATHRGRHETGAFLIEGPRAIDQIIRTHPLEIMEVLVRDGASPADYGYPIRTLSQSQFNAISSTRTPQNVMAVVRLPRDTDANSLPENIGRRLLLLEDIQDPGNVGTLIRTAAAFGFDGILLTPKCTDPFSPKCVQASAGTVLSLWLRRTPNYRELALQLKKKGFRFIAADLKGDPSPEILAADGPRLLALGNEAAGLSDDILELADHRIRLAIDRHKAESLNVAACGAIVMYLSSSAGE